MGLIVEGLGFAFAKALASLNLPEETEFMLEQ